ncbi:hypothetical protein [Desulfitobacterium hafniense]|uniref:Uncharacterized protein n=1 Tax=Desulfitobacterium hafniense (strain Y51) TaxID=138119 RepID=Q24VI1_DESHY|nr:hypothetical protein [Desulfitobacterium hafniense]BAE83961.1 hypothetical protein DSY2172 [Desulfitobacterium hafniense Y51]
MTLIIYDDTGMIFTQSTGFYQIPQGGVQFLEIEVPEGKRVAGVDVSATPHQVVLEDILPSEIEQLRLEMAQANTELFEMMLMLNGGGM